MENTESAIVDYNTNRKKLHLPEYGRNIQKMVDYAISLEDREKRNKIARAIIMVMGSINPYLRDIEENRHKLWDHLAMISDYKLDIDSPYPPPQPVDLSAKPNKVPYKSSKIKYKHYGRTIELLIDKAVQMEEESERNALIEIIANQMKKLFLTWNKESVNDSMILDTMKHLSGNKLNIPEGIKLMETKTIMSKNKRKKPSRRYRSDDKRR